MFFSYYIYNYINFTYIKLKLERLIRKSFLSGCKITLLLYLVNSTFYIGLSGLAFRLGFPGFQFLYRVSRSYTYKIYSSSVLIVKWERWNTRTTNHEHTTYYYTCTVPISSCCTVRGVYARRGGGVSSIPGILSYYTLVRVALAG